MMAGLERSIEILSSLTYEEAIQLDQELHGYIRLLEAWRTPAGELVAQVEHTAVGCDRLEYVRCGNKGCKCASGKPHGPYWYRYTYKCNGKQSKKYLGKERPL
jgi:hypothetical protein